MSDPIGVIEVRVALPHVPEGPRASERSGLILALLDVGLTDLEGVVPRIGDADLPPGFADAPLEIATVWEGTLDVSVAPFHLEWSLCDPEGDCDIVHVDGEDPARPEAAVAHVLDRAAMSLGRSPEPGAREAWRASLSPDPYAVLMAGRGAATFYGLSAPVPVAAEDTRSDPLARAVTLDPDIAPSTWLAARRDAARGKYERALQRLRRIQMVRPTSTIFAADIAAIHGLDGRVHDAARAWRDVEARRLDDPRFVVSVARALLAAGDANGARDRLAPLPEVFRTTASVASLRVAARQAGADDEDLDALLADWQRAAPDDPEPVRQRIALRVDDGRYADALALAPLLRDRGRMEDAEAAELALLAALGRFAEAATRADALGDTVTANRLRARAEGRALPWLADDPAPAARVWIGHEALATGDAAGALRAADEVLRRTPNDAAALALRARALDALGRTDDAGITRSRLRIVRPHSWATMSTAPGVTD